MGSDVYSFALKSALDEIRNLCPDVTGAFIFREDGEVVAGDGALSDKVMVRVIDAFDGIFDKADAIGGVNAITVDGFDGRVSVSRVNDVYMVIATSKKADVNYVGTVTRVLIPTVLRLLDKICPSPLKSKEPIEDFSLEAEESPPILEEKKESAIEATLVEEEGKAEEVKGGEVGVDLGGKAFSAEPPVNQLIVENIGGLLVPSDTVRVDPAVLEQWGELYEGIEIKEVDVETFGGKSVRCKVKPIKDSKYEGKGVIQVPEKLQSNLEVKKGELVRVKPVVE
jgi:predicted regulator of Ras-like GTPase activity (Roadblock/LC7/MglB family)